jgi:hypothetical protein
MAEPISGKMAASQQLVSVDGGLVSIPIRIYETGDRTAQRDRIDDDYLPKELLPLIINRPAASCTVRRLADFG